MMDFPPHIADRMRQGEIELCQIQFINIELVRQQSGDRWQHLKKKVFDIGAFFIEKRLHEDDVVLRCKDGFIVIFADARPPPPAQRSEGLSLEMNEFFVGDEAFRALAVKCNHLKLEPRELVAFLSGQGAKLDETVRRRNAETEADEGAAPPPIKACRPPPAPADPLETAEIVFEPVWDRRLEAVTTNMALARGVHPQTGHGLRGRQLCTGDDRRLHARHDILVLDRTIAEIGALQAAHRAAAFGLPVHLQTIHRRETRMEYFSRMRCLAEPLRRYLFFCIEGLAAGTPISQVEDAFRSLRPFGSGAMAMLDFGNADLRTFNSADVRLVGWPCPPHDRDCGLSDGQLEKIRRWVRIAQQGKMHTLMSNVSGRRVLEQCIDANIDIVAGPILGEPQSHAAPPYTLSHAELLDRSLDVFEI